MEKGNQSASPVVGPPSNVSSMLKSNNFSDSPSGSNCNTCQSPLHNIGTNSQSMSPYTAYNPDSKTEDVVLPKNGTNNCILNSGQTQRPYFTNDNSPLPAACTGSSTVGTISARAHSNAYSKRPISKLSGAGSPGEGVSGGIMTRAGMRSDKNHDHVNHGMLSRSLSVNNSASGKAAPNNIAPNVARRMCSVDSFNHIKDGTSSSGRPVANSSKLPENTSMRHSPRATGDLTSSDGRTKIESNSFNSSYEDNVTNAVKGKVIGASNPGARLNHLRINRTPSCNSVSDLSPCSEAAAVENATDKLTTSKSVTQAFDTTTSTVGSFPAECNNPVDTSMVDLNIDDTLLTMNDEINIDSLPNEAMGLDGFDFTNTGNGQDDIGSSALNLSVEEVQQALNSVSAENALPDITLSGTNCESTAATRLQTDGLNESDIDFNEMLPSTGDTSVPIATSSTTVADVSSMKSSTSKATNIDSLCSSFPNKTNSNSSIPTCISSSTTLSSPSVNSGAKSHLQEILGTADTNRLKNMARPVDSAHFQSTSSTSFSSNLHNNQTKSNPFTTQISSSAEHAMHQMPATSPSGMSPRLKFPSGNVTCYPRMIHRTASNPHPISAAAQHGYEMNHINSGMDSRRIAMPYGKTASGPHPMQDGNIPPYNLSSPQGMSSGTWQRQPSSGGMMSPHQLPVSMNDGGKSPRGGISFPRGPINPMSGLQSTVDAIPNLGMAKNNNNMGPPHACQRVPTPSEGCMSVPMSTMLPPPSPLTHDKRSVSADGSVTVSTISKGKSNKRERGQSLDSKDGDRKETGPKSKRKKSKSKDESSKKLDNRSAHRLNSIAAEIQYHVFNTDLINNASSAVSNQSDPSTTSIIQHHNRCQGNARLLPSKSLPFPPSQQNQIKMEHSPHNLPTAGKCDTKVFSSNASSVPTTPNSAIKNEVLAGHIPSSHVKSEQKSSVISSQVKSDAERSSELTSNVVSPSVNKREANEESLTDEQRRQREDKLDKIKRMRAQLLPEQKPPASTSVARSSTSATTNKHNSAINRVLKKVQESNKDSSPEGNWFRLVQAYNEEKRRSRQNHSADDPPPYNSAAPSPFPPRWIGPGHPIREPGAAPDLPNPRYPHHGAPGPLRLPHDAALGSFPASYGPGRFPRNFIVSGAPSNRMPVYPGSNPSSGMAPRTPLPRLPQPHHIGPHNEAYPFSEKLKEQASIYRSEGMLNQAGGMGYDPNNPSDPAVGPRMGSPDWIPYGNPSRNMANLPLEGVSPTAMLPNSGPMPSQAMESSMLPGNVDTGMEHNMVMRMNNPAMMPSYTINSFVTKGSAYPASSLPALSKSFPPSMRTDGVSGIVHDGGIPSGMMGDTMARRGETRPPDLNINTAIGRSSPNFHSGRHPMPSPGMAGNPSMMPSQYLPGDPGPHVQSALPHMSPHPSNMPRSPMVNSPNLMKSPIGGQMQFVGMGQGGSMQSLDQQSMMHGGPRSAGPVSGTPSDWGGLMPQTSAMHQPSRIQSSGPVMQGQQKPAIQQMIDGVNRFQLPNTPYQNEVKDTSSPPHLSHMMEAPNLPQEPPPLSHNPSSMDGGGMPAAPGSSPMMMRHPHSCGPIYDSGIRAAGPRMMAPVMVDNYGPEYNGSPSHPGVCMSPGTPCPQGMMQSGMMEMHGPGVTYISQPNMMPPNDNQSGGGMQGHPGCNHPIQFDLVGILPSDKPSETLSYFPSAGRNPQDSVPIDATPSAAMTMRSPSMTQQSLNRFPGVNMNQRPLTSNANPYPGNNPAPRMPGHPGFGGPNPPGYPGPVVDGYMSPSWDGIGRPPLGGAHNIRMHFQSNRPLI